MLYWLSRNRMYIGSEFSQSNWRTREVTPEITRVRKDNSNEI